MRVNNSCHFKTIICLNIIGFTLFLSWYLPENHGFWLSIDSAVFYYFNHLLAADHTLASIVAILNHRFFDVVTFLFMGMLFLYLYIPQDKAMRRKMFFMGVTMLLCAVVINQLGRQLPVLRPSPTMTFPDIFRAAQATGINGKDGSGDSFPGDHGTMLLIFAGFMLRYFSRKAFVLALSLMVLFSFPRIMIGSHWFTDIYVGSVSLTFVLLSWFLCTPASDYVIDRLNRLFPGKHRPVP